MASRTQDVLWMSDRRVRRIGHGGHLNTPGLSWSELVQGRYWARAMAMGIVMIAPTVLISVDAEASSAYVL